MRVIYSILCILFFISCEDGNESPALSTEGVGSSLARFTITNDFLYVVNNTDLLSIDISNAEHPAVSNHVEVGRGIETIYPYYNYLLIGSSNAMYIYSIKDDPSTPTLLSTFEHWEACDPVVAQGDYAYVTLREGTGCRMAFPINQLDVVNIEDPQNPYQVAQLPMKHPHGLGASGNKLFVCEGSYGLTQVNITDPSAPKIDTTYTGFHAYDVIVRNNHLIVTGNDGYFQFYVTETGLQQISKIEFL